MPIFRACKNAKIALQHPIIFGVLASPWTTLKTEKRKFACSWGKWKVSLDTLPRRSTDEIIIGSAEALPILCVRYILRWERERERERERDTERERERERRKWRHHCRAKLAMNLHFPFAKIRTIGDEFTLSLAKNSHFSFLPSHFPSLPSRRGHHCSAEIRNEFTLSVAKIFFAFFVPTLSNGASRATSDRKPKTNDQILPSPILFFPSKNWIKLIPKTIGNRKRDCAWGGLGW